MAQDATKPAKRAPSPVKNGYLILYNAVSTVLWATVLGRTVATNILQGPEFVFLATGDFVLWTQTLMILDVVHGVFGTCSCSHPQLRFPVPHSLACLPLHRHTLSRMSVPTSG